MTTHSCALNFKSRMKMTTEIFYWYENFCNERGWFQWLHETRRSVVCCIRERRRGKLVPSTAAKIVEDVVEQWRLVDAVDHQTKKFLCGFAAIKSGQARDCRCSRPNIWERDGGTEVSTRCACGFYPSWSFLFYWRGHVTELLFFRYVKPFLSSI